MKVENRLYKTSEAAKMLGVTQRTMYNYIKGNQIKVIRRGVVIYIDGEELLAFMGRKLDKGYYKGLYGNHSEE